MEEAKEEWVSEGRTKCKGIGGRVPFSLLFFQIKYKEEKTNAWFNLNEKKEKRTERYNRIRWKSDEGRGGKVKETKKLSS